MNTVSNTRVPFFQNGFDVSVATHGDEDKREEWAASIWQWQKIRRREREERRRIRAANQARVEEAERRDEEKERRWGPGWRKEEGTGPGGRRKGGGGGKDRKGYYKLLGLQDKMGAATLVRKTAHYPLYITPL